jgi:Zn-dependent M28 family amino/carboxypeptidase
MFGGHYDSWHTGTGATDNGCGSAVMMEAARLLQKLIQETGIKPRRTLRIALWSGEEQGLLGSRAYCDQHFAVRDTAGEIVALKPDQLKISAYYNLDNGTGKIRGIYLQANGDVAPAFREWLDDWKDLGANTMSLSNTGGTDHLSFDRVGIPGFQFIQDPVEYDTRTHHSNMDTWEHLLADDLKQAATIVASFVWQTAQRDEMLPRKKLVLKTAPNSGSR